MKDSGGSANSAQKGFPNSGDPGVSTPWSATSPHLGAVFGLQIQFRSRWDLECFIPGVDIANSVAAVFPGKMRIASDLLAQGGLALQLSPALGECQEKPLLAGQPVNHYIRLAL